MPKVLEGTRGLVSRVATRVAKGPRGPWKVLEGLTTPINIGLLTTVEQESIQSIQSIQNRFQDRLYTLQVIALTA